MVAVLPQGSMRGRGPEVSCEATLIINIGDITTHPDPHLPSRHRQCHRHHVTAIITKSTKTGGGIKFSLIPSHLSADIMFHAAEHSKS